MYYFLVVNIEKFINDLLISKYMKYSEMMESEAARIRSILPFNYFVYNRSKHDTFMKNMGNARFDRKSKKDIIVDFCENKMVISPVYGVIAGFVSYVKQDPSDRRKLTLISNEDLTEKIGQLNLDKLDRIVIINDIKDAISTYEKQDLLIKAITRLRQIS